MRSIFSVIIASVILVLVGEIGFAQNANHQRFREKVLASNLSFQKQSHLLDSVISKYLDKDDDEDEGSLKDEEEEFIDWEDNPADDIYGGRWSTVGVNANRVAVRDLPDSVVIDCKNYVAPCKGVRTSPFGPRSKRYHYGIDLRVSIGEPIGSAFEGKVRVTRYDHRGYGYYVVVRHPNGLETLYGHLSEIKVFEGQSVVAGQCIGLGGNTGRSTGPHLHFEARFLGNPINPEQIFDFHKYKPLTGNYFLVKSVAFDYTKNAKANRAKSGVKSRYHKVRKGESLSLIAKRYGTTVKRICKLNRISRRTTLRPGQRLRL